VLISKKERVEHRWREPGTGLELYVSFFKNHIFVHISDIFRGLTLKVFLLQLAPYCLHPPLPPPFFFMFEMAISPPISLQASLELGGKNATVVFADKFTGENGAAALAATAKAVVRSAFLNSGQICLCGSRILVEESVMPQFQEALVKETLALRVGDPLQVQEDD
jgi:hypothetical protein